MTGTRAADSIRARLRREAAAYPELAWFAQTVEQLPATVLSTLPQSALVVVMPDGLMQGLHRELIAVYGQQVHTFRVQRLTQARAERLYFDGLVTDAPERHIGAWWLKSKLFRLGESMGLFLRDAQRSELQQVLTQAKGASDPLLAAQGSYRERYRTPNKTFALLHSSDDLFAMLYEVHAYFGSDDLASFLERSSTCDDVDLRLLSAYEPAVRVDRIDAHAALCRLKRRVLLELRATAPPLPPTALTHLSAVLDVYERIACALQRGLSFQAERDAVAELIEAEARLVEQIASGLDLAEPRACALLVALKVLSRPEGFARLEFGALTAALAQAGITLAEQDEIVLESALFFDRGSSPSSRSLDLTDGSDRA